MQSLPIHALLPDIKDALTELDQLILEAPPGAGKTTVVPLALLEQPWLGKQKIIMLEPRRLAARTAAERMASLLQEPVGQTVGYRMRFDSKVTHKTRIEVVTEGIFTLMLQDDPSLEGIGLVIFDEFHERSLDADLALTLTLQGREFFREEQPLKLVLMSATLESNSLETLLPSARVIRSEGRLHPIDIIYSRQAMPKSTEIISPVVNLILQALTDQQGSVLVFLPGQAEISRVQTALAEHIVNNETTFITPLYGTLTIDQQRQAVEPAPAGKRKVVLATNIAETSITIEGVRVVIDSGFSRQALFDPKTGMTKLHTRRISRASSIQRSGRAGRMEPGCCYRLWTEDQQQQLALYNDAEITNADLTQLALQLFRWGASHPNELEWLTPPPTGAYAQAVSLLTQLGALTKQKGQHKITPYGESLSTLPTHPRLAHLIHTGAQLNLVSQASKIAALLSERDPLSDSDSSLNKRLKWLNSNDNYNKAAKKRINQQADRLASLCTSITPTDKGQITNPNDPCWTGLLLVSAYPDRIAKKRSDKQGFYKLSNGRSAQLSEQDELHKSDWLAVAHLGGVSGREHDRIFLASELDLTLVKRHSNLVIEQRDQIYWDNNADKLVAVQQQLIGELVISSKPLPQPASEQCVQAIINMVQHKGLSCLPWTPELTTWRQRVNFLHQQHAQQQDNPWPDLSDLTLLKSLDDWLAPFITEVRNLNQLKALNLKSVLECLLPWPLPQQLDELAPSHFTVPTGNRVRIDYSQSPPVLAVKLQEMFGSTATPTIGNHTSLMLHLLSPARRPLQITQDLASFWLNGYAEVQKDMKGRYPKHPWPDNPQQAVATARVKHPKK